MTFNKNLAAMIAEEFKNKRLARNELISRRRAELYGKIPTLKELDDEIAGVGFSMFKKVADGYDKDAAAKEIRTKSQALCKMRDKLIKDAGFPVNYLNPAYDCPDCRDEGFIENEYCHCFRKKIVEAALGESNLVAFSGNSFEKFSLDWYPDESDGKNVLSPRANMKRILDISIKYAESFDSMEDNLLLTGPSGLGKTFLSSCIANALINKGVNVIYQSASVIFSLLDRVKFSKNVPEEDLYTASRLIDCDLLILDDLGTEFITEFSTGELFRILNLRKLNGKKTIISTNLSLGDLKNTYSERIFSRIAGDFTIMKFYGKDIRFIKKL